MVKLLVKELYSLIYKDDKKALIKLCNENHPIFKAHFPSQPILPGFVHFEIVADVFSIKITTIKKAKFTKIVRPTQSLEYKKDGNKFKVFCEDEVVASFSL
ncbi:hypothetical protein [Sulfurimonas sp. CS5]|uniref:hypothetical protein n=1 Tax=Sulfurimonas sp. CS5 TaxID=3391145 RepID=UPI0039EB7F50